MIFGVLVRILRTWYVRVRRSIKPVPEADHILLICGAWLYGCIRPPALLAVLPIAYWQRGKFANQINRLRG